MILLPKLLCRQIPNLPVVTSEFQSNTTIAGTAPCLRKFLNIKPPFVFTVSASKPLQRR